MPWQCLIVAAERVFRRAAQYSSPSHIPCAPALVDYVLKVTLSCVFRFCSHVLRLGLLMLRDRTTFEQMVAAWVTTSGRYWARVEPRAHAVQSDGDMSLLGAGLLAGAQLNHNHVSRTTSCWLSCYNTRKDVSDHRNRLRGLLSSP